MSKSSNLRDRNFNHTVIRAHSGQVKASARKRRNQNGRGWDVRSFLKKCEEERNLAGLRRINIFDPHRMFSERRSWWFN